MMAGILVASGHISGAAPNVNLSVAAALKSDADIYVNLAVAYDRRSMKEKMIEALRMALELNPVHPQATTIRLTLESTMDETGKP